VSKAAPPRTHTRSLAHKHAHIVGTADEIRPEAASVVAALGAAGMEVWMVTGDARRVALAVAAAVGIPAERVVAHATPADKVRARTHARGLLPPPPLCCVLLRLSRRLQAGRQAGAG
jgi:hypothetical protein